MDETSVIFQYPLKKIGIYSKSTKKLKRSYSIASKRRETLGGQRTFKVIDLPSP